MNYFLIILIWVLYSSYLALVTYSISLYFEKKFTLYDSVLHFTIWISFPLLMILWILAVVGVLIIKDYEKEKADKIFGFGKVIVQSLICNYNRK